MLLPWLPLKEKLFDFDVAGYILSAIWLTPMWDMIKSDVCLCYLGVIERHVYITMYIGILSNSFKTKSIKCPVKCGMTLLIHFQTSTVASLIFEYGYVIPNHILWWKQSLNHAGIYVEFKRDQRNPYLYIDGLVQGKRNVIANALELRLSCTKPLILWLQVPKIWWRNLLVKRGPENIISH